MQALPIGEDFPVREDARAGLIRGLEGIALDAFSFARAEATSSSALS